MLKLDECNQILVTSPFSDDTTPASPHSDQYTPTVTSTADSSSEHHPLRSRSVSPACRRNAPSVPSVTIIDSEGGMRPRLTGALSSDGVLLPEATAEEDPTADGEAPRDGSEIIMHTVGPNDSLAGVALHYGVSIAALRRANQLWPSDPIHLRTELLIPRGDTLRSRHKSFHRVNMDRSLQSQSTVEPMPSLSTDLLASSFVTARNMIVSVLPARISMESLSSKTSTSEDHELDDFQKVRARRMSATGTSSTEEGYELSTLTAPHVQYRRHGIPLAPQACSPADKDLDGDPIFPTDHSHSRCISSSLAASLERPSRAQPFVVLPVRTSQLEPEPAMELPARRPHVQRSHLWTDYAPQQN